MTARAACRRPAARAPPRFCGAWHHPCDTTFEGCGGGGITRMIPPCPRQDSNRNPPWPPDFPARIPIGIHPANPRLCARLPTRWGPYPHPGQRRPVCAALGALRAAQPNTCERNAAMTNFDETKTIDAETLWNTPIPPVRWVVPDLLPAGLSILAGTSKAGKSWLCLWLCLQIARGGQVWGRQVSSQPVLYLCLEDTFNRIQSRLLQIDGEGGSPNLLFQTRSGGIGQGLEAEITAALNHHPGIGLVVIDTLQKVRSVDPSGSAYAADYRDMSALKQLADAHHICILLVHHLRKQGAEDPFAQISGSTGIIGAADTIWLLQRQRMSPTARLQVTGRDVESRALTLEFNDCVWDLLEETTDRQQAEQAVPAWLWRAADFLAGQAAWQGTASQLLAAAGIDGVQPNQFTRSLVQHYHQVFAPCGLRFASRRTANARLLTFTRDDDDGDDDTVAGSPGGGGIPKTPSSSSSPSFWTRDGNEHGLCVATGQPFAGPGAPGHMGASPNPVALPEAAQ